MHVQEGGRREKAREKQREGGIVNARCNRNLSPGLMDLTGEAAPVQQTMRFSRVDIERRLVQYHSHSLP